jgi:hypothetical protein
MKHGKSDSDSAMTNVFGLKTLSFVEEPPGHLRFSVFSPYFKIQVDGIDLLSQIHGVFFHNIIHKYQPRGRQRINWLRMIHHESYRKGKRISRPKKQKTCNNLMLQSIKGFVVLWSIKFQTYNLIHMSFQQTPPNSPDQNPSDMESL